MVQNDLTYVYKNLTEHLLTYFPTTERSASYLIITIHLSSTFEKDQRKKEEKISQKIEDEKNNFGTVVQDNFSAL